MNEDETVQAIQDTFPGTEEMPVDPDLQKLFDLVEREIIAWRPDPGSKVGGTLRDITESNEGEFGPYTILLIESPDGRLQGVHCFHKVLRGEVERRIDRGTFRVGDQIAIMYIGEADKATSGKNPANMYRVVVRRPE